MNAWREGPIRIRVIPTLVLVSVLSVSARVDAVLAQQAADPSLELLWEVGAQTEGPAVLADGSVYFVDLDLAAGGTVWRFDPVSRVGSVLRQPGGLAAGLKVGPDGQLYAAELAHGGGRRLARINPSTGETTALVDQHGGRRVHGANDLVFDDKGRVYFTEYPLLSADEAVEHLGSGVYRLDPDGAVVRVITNAGRPNGIAISPDQTRLYVGTNEFDVLGTSAILEYHVNHDGSVEFARVLHRLEAGQGLSHDGIALDQAGNLYVALFSRSVQSGVAVLDPEGRQTRFVATPGPATNVAFGIGPDARIIYITAGTGLYRIEVRRPGHQPPWLR